MLKEFVREKLENYVRKYFRTHPKVKLIVVAGSVGKTSTKVAIAEVLKSQFTVRVDELNRNAELSAPTSILGIDFPDSQLKNPLAWLGIFRAARAAIRSTKQPDFIVQEIGTEKIGEIPQFGTYLKPDLCVISAITPEHMEFFDGSMDKVAKEELTAANFSKKALINSDSVEEKYLKKYLKNPNTVYYNDCPDLALSVIGKHSRYPLVAAATVGEMFGVSTANIKKALKEINPLPGRMNLLRGKNGSLIIDDTFNSSPAAAAAALQALYDMPAKTRVAVLGSMKELGETSKREHEDLAKLLDPKKLSEVIITHDDAVKYLAPAATKRGLKVTVLDDALKIGDYLKDKLTSGEVLLFKSSYGNIYLEEAIKPLLADPKDARLLPRQFEPWLSRKRQTFNP